jgi:surfactin synthase thioesterase subunit
MQPWARETRNDFDLRLFAGGHFFFLGQALPGFTRQVVDAIAPYAAPGVS